MLMNSSYLLLNGLRVHYLHWNIAESGRPALLLHGLASNARIWELTVPYLAGSGMAPLLAPDARGHGLTDKPDGDYSFDIFNQDLLAFLEVMNLEKPLLIGHSWGANLAVSFASRFSTGPRAPAGLVLVDGGLTQLDDLPGATWESTSQRLTPPRLTGTPLNQFIERISLGGALWKPGAAELPIILANFDVDEDDRISPRLTFDHHMQIVRAMWEFPTYERLGRVRCPVLAIPARPAEPSSPQEAAFLQAKEIAIQKAQQRLPGLQVSWMLDSVHDIPLQRPAELAAEISSFSRQLEKG